MMKHIIFTGALLLTSAMAGEAMAACGTNLVSNLKSVLPGNTICQPLVAPVPPAPWTAQEMHDGTTGTSITGNVTDFKRGVDPVDPTKVLGTYTLTNVGSQNCTTNPGTGNDVCNRVTYNYTAFTPNYTATFEVYLVSGTAGSAGSVYDFCTGPSGTPAATGYLKIGTGVGCP